MSGNHLNDLSKIYLDKVYKNNTETAEADKSRWEDLGGPTPIVPRIIFVCWCLLRLVQFVESERHKNCCSIGKWEGPPADLVILVSRWGLVVFCKAFHIEAVGYGK